MRFGSISREGVTPHDTIFVCAACSKLEDSAQLFLKLLGKRYRVRFQPLSDNSSSWLLNPVRSGSKNRETKVSKYKTELKD